MAVTIILADDGGTVTAITLPSDATLYLDGTGHFTLPTGSGGFVPLVDGSEPPNFITDGSGNLIFVAYP